MVQRALPLPLSFWERVGVRGSWLRSGVLPVRSSPGPDPAQTVLARPLTPALSRREREQP